MQSFASNQSGPSHHVDRAATRAFLVVGVVAFLCGLFVAVHTVYLTLLVQTPLLLADEWRVLPKYIEFKMGKLSLLSFLWEDHFGHRPVLARFLFILDAETMGGTQVLSKTISLGLCGLLAALFATLLLRLKQIPLGTRLIGIGLVILVLLPNQQVENFAIGWNNAILTTVWFSVLALYLLTKSIEKGLNGNRSIALFVCAILSGILATCSMANGLLTWPIMFLVCAQFRNWRYATIVALVGTAVITTYLWDYHRTGLLLIILTQPHALLLYLIAFLGNPAIALGLQVSTLFGVLGILLVGYHFFRQSWRTDRDSPAVWFLLSVCLFVIATAGLTSVGRLTFGTEVGVQPTNVSAIGPLALRYYSFISPLWAAILLLGFIQLKRNLESTARGVCVLFDAGVLVVSIGMCGSAYFIGPSSVWLTLNRHDLFEWSATAIVAGAPDQVVLKHVYSFPDINIFSSVPYLVSNRLSLFHSNIDYFLYQKAHEELHKPLSDYMLLDGKWCVGSIDEINKLTDVEWTSVIWNKVSGWTLDRERERAADGVLFADEEGRLVGIGRVLTARPDVDEALNLKHAQLMLHFMGYAQTAASQSIVAYAYTFDRKDLCRFGEMTIRQ
jgi:hypothetical protein